MINQENNQAISHDNNNTDLQPYFIHTSIKFCNIFKHSAFYVVFSCFSVCLKYKCIIKTIIISISKMLVACFCSVNLTFSPSTALPHAAPRTSQQ